MRRVALIVLFALPTLGSADPPPTPAAGKITFATERLTALDNYINAAECRGGSLTVKWAIAYDEGKSFANLL